MPDLLPEIIPNDMAKSRRKLALTKIQRKCPLDMCATYLGDTEDTR